MKRTTALAVFLCMSGGVVGASALSNNSMRGSDTLKPFTLSMLSTMCPTAAGIQYFGGGSFDGNLLGASPSQTVEPMSRFLLSFDSQDEGGDGPADACHAADPTKAEGIAFAVDGLTPVLSGTHRAACDPTNAAGGTSCVSAGPSGLRSSGVLTLATTPPTTYTLGANSAVTHVEGWRDVLRLIYMGLPNTAGANPQGVFVDPPPARALRDCNSLARQALVNNWGNLFENACEATGGTCTQLNHAFRGDAAAGASGEMLRELINARFFPFCNQRFAGDTTPAEYPTTLSDGSPVFNESYQDFDPIRRLCAGGQIGGGGSLPGAINNPDGTQSQPDYPATPAEQVCGPKGTLGLVLPIVIPSFAGAITAQLYPTKPCLRGALAFGPAPKLPGSANFTLCPNGDVTVGNSAAQYDPTTGVIHSSSGTCLVPASVDGDFRCINGKNNFNSPLDPPFGVIPAAQRDGRVFNLHLYTVDGHYRSDNQLGQSPFPNVVGDFSRIHTTRTLLNLGPTCPGAGGDGRCCASLNASTLVSCIAQADPCSLGLTGANGTTFQLQTSAASPEFAFGTSINNIQSATSCISSTSYPLSGKLYVNTLIGFDQVNGQELALTKCFANSGSTLLASDFFPLSTGPVCQDFAQEGCGLGLPASDACIDNPSGIPRGH